MRKEAKKQVQSISSAGMQWLTPESLMNVAASAELRVAIENAGLASTVMARPTNDGNVFYRAALYSLLESAYRTKAFQKLAQSLKGLPEIQRQSFCDLLDKLKIGMSYRNEKESPADTIAAFLRKNALMEETLEQAANFILQKVHQPQFQAKLETLSKFFSANANLVDCDGGKLKQWTQGVNAPTISVVIAQGTVNALVERFSPKEEPPAQISSNDGKPRAGGGFVTRVQKKSTQSYPDSTSRPTPASQPQTPATRLTNYNTRQQKERWDTKGQRQASPNRVPKYSISSKDSETLNWLSLNQKESRLEMEIRNEPQQQWQQQNQLRSQNRAKRAFQQRMKQGQCRICRVRLREGQFQMCKECKVLGRRETFYSEASLSPRRNSPRRRMVQRPYPDGIDTSREQGLTLGPLHEPYVRLGRAGIASRQRDFGFSPNRLEGARFGGSPIRRRIFSRDHFY